MARMVVDPRFRAVLANLIMSAGIRQAELARRACLSPSHLSQILNGDRNPSDQMARALDAALGADGQLADLVLLAANPEDLDRLAAATANPRRIGFATIESLARVLAAQRNLDDVMGSAAVVGSTVAQLHTLTVMVNEAAGPDRPAVLYEAGQWAQFAAWLHISVGKQTEARAWLARALQWSMECGDADLIATVLSYQAHSEWLSLRWGPTVGLAQAALRDPAVYPGQRAYDAYQAARGSAALGDLVEARRMLDRADGYAADTESWDGQPPPWQYYRAPWFWALERGLVSLYMARREPAYASAAVADLQAGIDGLPDEMSGADWVAEYLVHLASAHRRTGERDAARSTLGRAKFIADATHSGRVLRLVAVGERSLRVNGD